jgi:hypothetical protein
MPQLARVINPSRPLSREETKDACNRYLQGQKIGAIARHYHVSSERVRRLLQKNDIDPSLYKLQLDPREYPLGRVGDGDPMGWLTLTK